MFESERLVYRIAQDDDLDDLHSCLNTRFMSQSLSWLSHPFEKEEAQSWIDRGKEGFEKDEEWHFAARLKQDYSYVGNVNIHCNSPLGNEIGYWVHENYMGQGYASEMLHELLSFCVQKLELDSFRATAALNNLASHKILEKNGFEKIEEISVKSSDGPRPSYLFEKRYRIKS